MTLSAPYDETGVVRAWRQHPKRANMLRRPRGASGLTRLALAAAAGITHEVVFRIEQEQRVKTVDPGVHSHCAHRLKT